MSIHEKSRTNEVLDVIAQSSWHMDILRVVRELRLNDWMIGAGFVRNAVWDHLHDFRSSTPLADIDVIYFDRSRMDSHHDQEICNQLNEIRPDVPWSVRNQARMHVRNDDAPYTSSTDAIAHWLETPTCIATWLDQDDCPLVVAPHGVDDLCNLKVCPTTSGKRKLEVYRERIRSKNWEATWPRLKISLIE